MAARWRCAPPGEGLPARWPAAPPPAEDGERTGAHAEPRGGHRASGGRGRGGAAEIAEGLPGPCP
eukprot:7871447-Pyramimonas_sp.AAC.1